jgi:hypothetical protein
MKTKAWLLSIAVICLAYVVFHYSTSTSGLDGGNHNRSEGKDIPANPKPEAQPRAVTPLEAARDSKDVAIVKHAVAKVISLVPRLKNATLTEASYIEELKKLGAEMTGQDLRDLFASLIDEIPPIPNLEQILIGAAQADPVTVWQIAQDNKMDNVSNLSNIEVLGAIYANLVPLDRAAAIAFLEKVGDADVIKKAALTKIAARDGVNAVLDIIVDSGSPFYSKDSYGSVWAITNQVKTSGWSGLQDLADKLVSRAPELGANAVIQPVTSMAELRPVETMEEISKWPASEAKSIAVNSAMSTIARTNPDLALDLTAKFQGTQQEQNNLLLGLQSAFLGINRQDLRSSRISVLLDLGRDAPGRRGCGCGSCRSCGSLWPLL